MSDTAAKLDILIAIKAQLDELVRTKKELKETRSEAESFGSILKQGLGIGTGMEIARSAISLVKQVITETIGESIRLSGEIKDQAANLGISTNAYQVLGAHVKSAGGDMASLTGALNTQQRSLNEAVNSSVSPAAAAYRALGLSVVALQGMTLERQFEAVARAISSATNKQEAFRSATVLLGERHVPRLRQALRELGEDGYDTLAKKADASVIKPEAIAILTAAADAWKRAKDILISKVGEDVAKVLGALGFKGELEQPPTKNPAELAAAQQLADQQKELSDARASLSRAQLGAGNAAGDTTNTEMERRAILDKYYDRQIEKLQIILNLRKKMPLAQGETGEMRSEETRKLEAELTDAQNAARANLGAQPSAATRSRDAVSAVNDPSQNSGFLTAGEGVMAGFQNWAAQAGSVGQQIAGSLQNTIGTVTQGIGSTIASWATTGRVSLESIQQLGMTIFTSMLTTLVQIGVQQVINGNAAKAIALGWKALTSSLRAADTAETVSSEAAKTPLLATNAALSSASSYGLSAVIGIAALALLIGAFIAGFSDGGYTGAGGRFTPAGVVHKGEVVFSQDDIARHGGVDKVESMRLGGGVSAGDFTANEGQPGMGSTSAALAAGGSSAAGYAAVSSRPQRTLVLVDSREMLDQMRRDPAWDSHVVDSVSRNKGVLLNG